MADLRAGNDPAEVTKDPQVARTLLANERTYLAWVRTALALVAAGVAVSKLLPPIELIGGRRVLGTLLVALGAATGVLAYLRWRTNDRLIRRGEGLQTDRAPQLMAAIVAAAVAAGFIASIVTTR